MASVASDVPPYLPAWKKLGLRLKLQQEASESKIDLHANVSPKRKRDESNSEDHAIRIAKKLAKDITLEHGTPKLCRKKSVTFTPETKLEDGDSIKKIFNSWVAGQNSRTPSLERTNFDIFKKLGVDQVTEKSNPSVDKRKEKKRSHEKQKASLARSPVHSPDLNNVKPSTTIPPFLQYLRQYHDSRDTWKFNKNHQTHLLQHVFDVDIVPSNYAHFIYAYIKGLQGNVRTRLRDAALSIKVKDQEGCPGNFPENTPDLEGKQEEYDTALTEYLTANTISHARVLGHEEKSFVSVEDKVVKGQLIKRTRAEMILNELASSPETNMFSGSNSVSENQKMKPSDTVIKKFSRRRKQRTITSKESSTDETSSSDDSDDSDGSDLSSESLHDVKSLRPDLENSNNSTLDSDSSSTSDSDSDSD